MNRGPDGVGNSPVSNVIYFLLQVWLEVNTIGGGSGAAESALAVPKIDWVRLSRTMMAVPAVFENGIDHRSIYATHALPIRGWRIPGQSPLSCFPMG